MSGGGPKRDQPFERAEEKGARTGGGVENGNIVEVADRRTLFSAPAHPYTSALLYLKFGVSMWWGLVAAAALSSVMAFLLGALILLMTCGMVLSFAASPPVAERIGLSPWFFIIRHALFCLAALPVLIFTWANNAERAWEPMTSAMIVVLLAVLLLMNGLVVFLRRKYERRW